jgi:hypothetical protein
MIGHDPIGPNQHQQISALFPFGAGNLLGPLHAQAALDLGADGGHRDRLAHDQRVAAGMKDEGVGGAFDIDRAAIVTAFAAIGDQRETLLLALPRFLQVLERPFHAHQVLGEPDQVGLGSGGLVAGLCCRLALFFKLILPASKAHLLCIELSPEFLVMLLPNPNLFPGLLGLSADSLQVLANGFLFHHQLLMQLQAAAFPLGFLLGGQAEVSVGGLDAGQEPGPGHDPRPAVEHQH